MPLEAILSPVERVPGGVFTPSTPHRPGVGRISKGMLLGTGGGTFLLRVPKLEPAFQRVPQTAFQLGSIEGSAEPCVHERFRKQPETHAQAAT